MTPVGEFDQAPAQANQANEFEQLPVRQGRLPDSVDVSAAQQQAHQRGGGGRVGKQGVEQGAKDLFR
jgi:hypothetical protein